MLLVDSITSSVFLFYTFYFVRHVFLSFRLFIGHHTHCSLVNIVKVVAEQMMPKLVEINISLRKFFYPLKFQLVL